MSCSSVYVQFHFSNEEQELTFSGSHGNDKKRKLQKKTTFSVKNEIKNLNSSGLKCLKIFRETIQNAGGIKYRIKCKFTQFL